LERAIVAARDILRCRVESLIGEKSRVWFWPTGKIPDERQVDFEAAVGQAHEKEAAAVYATLVAAGRPTMDPRQTVAPREGDELRRSSPGLSRKDCEGRSARISK
jgi:hypothetical protein